jgi:membrane protein DedA with SNARE-associated domain
MPIINLMPDFQYFAVFLGSLLNGPAAMITTGFLVKLGYLNPVPAFFLLLLGDLVGDFAYYGIGYFGLDRLICRYGHLFHVTYESLKKVEKMFKKHTGKILLISKMTMGCGLALPILIAAGIVKVSLKKYGLYNLAGGLIRTLLMMSIGYLFSNVYGTLEGTARVIFLIAIVVLLILTYYAANCIIRAKMPIVK